MSTEKYVAFCGHQRIAEGALLDVALSARAHPNPDHQRLAFYRCGSGAAIDLDLRGTASELAERLAATPSPTKQGRGRPKLGVVSREVSLLPRHWTWLATQRSTASATLRLLVDQAMRQRGDDDRARAAVDATHKFIWDIAGDLPGFEEASRALYAGDYDRFLVQITSWPGDLRDQCLRFLEPTKDATPTGSRAVGEVTRRSKGTRTAIEVCGADGVLTSTLDDTPVGPVSLSATANGLTEIRLRAQRAGRPVAGSSPAAQVLHSATRQLQEYFAGERQRFDLPLAATGTPFQRRVWRALLEIPFGALACYGDIARSIARPKAVRAVGAANGKNPLPIVVPCHRVIGSDATLTGYASGLPLKTRLLEHEGIVIRDGRIVDPPWAQLSSPTSP